MSSTMVVEVVSVGGSTERAEAMAGVGFLAGYCGTTRISYATDLRLFATRCDQGELTLFSVRRAHLELFGRWMEENGPMRSTVARRLSTLARYYRYCEQEQLAVRNPALHVRRPKVDYESRTLGLDRNELGAFLVQAGLGSARDHAVASLLALNGLRISEALDADIDDLDFERGHRTLKILRKGGKHAIIPLAPRTARVLDLYIGERAAGPISVGAKAHGWTATRPTAPSSGWPAAPGSPSRSVLKASGFIHNRSPQRGVPLRDVQEAASHPDPRTTMRYDRGR